MSIRDFLSSRLVFADGGFGSLLIERGFPGGVPEEWNLSHPDAVESIHRDYFRAGSDIVNSNTFGANRLHYPDPAELEAVVRAGVRLVREAREQAGRADGFVALDIGPTGRLLKPMGDLDFEEAVALFGEMARWGEAAGADLALIGMKHLFLQIEQVFPLP